jgi:ATP-dependent exoDNAse (exonuclease V) alpha subunit
VVVGKAGAGKTYALGVARHAWQLDGYRVLGAAPAGIATVCLEAEGFERSRTVDALLAELDAERAADGRRQRGGRQPTLSPRRQPPPGHDRDTARIERASDDGQGERVLDSRTVLVVDEAGMLGSRKLARLLDYAAETRAKVVLVGDDKQLASIEAGGGFRGLRLRLGASTLTENRRQAEPWEREAVEHLRDGNIDAALNAYREHDRLVAVETPGQLKETGGGRSSRATASSSWPTAGMRWTSSTPPASSSATPKASSARNALPSGIAASPWAIRWCAVRTPPGRWGSPTPAAARSSPWIPSNGR